MKNTATTRQQIITIGSTDQWNPERTISPAQLNGALMQAKLAPSVTPEGMLWIDVRHPSDVYDAQQQMLRADILLLRGYGVYRDPEAKVFVNGLSFGQGLVYVHDYRRYEIASQLRRKLESLTAAE